MKLFNLKFKKKSLKIDSLHKQSFNPTYFWTLSLIIFVCISFLGSLLGVKFFRSVYFEDFKNTDGTAVDISASMNIKGLKRVIDLRTAARQQNIPTPPDPSM